MAKISASALRFPQSVQWQLDVNIYVTVSEKMHICIAEVFKILFDTSCFPLKFKESVSGVRLFHSFQQLRLFSAPFPKNKKHKTK